MTRKKYINKIQALTLAVYRHPESNFLHGFKVGEALKHVKEHAKTVPKTYGSYEAAWNDEALKWAREHYGVK